MGDPAKKLPDPEAWGDREIEHNTRLLEEYDSGAKQFTGDPAVLETVRLGLQWRADQQAGDADALDLPFATWRAANTPALPADAPLQPGEDPSDAPLARSAAQPPAPPQPPADPETSLWQRFLGMGNEALRTADDAAGSFMRTDFTDKLGAAVADAIPVPGINKDENVYAEGNSYQSLAQGTARDMAEAEARSPWATATGDAAQIAGSAMIGGAAPAAASLPARVAAGAAEGAAIGGAQAVGELDPAADEAAMWRAYLEGGETGAMLGGAAPVAGQVIGEGAQAINRGRNALAEATRRSGLRNRAAAAGFYGGDLKRAVKEQGRDLPERIGQAIEDAGADRRVGGFLPEGFPMGSSAYASSLEAAKGRVGQQIGGAVDEATSRGAAIPQRDVAAAMRGRQAEALAQNVDSGDAMASHIDDITSRLTAERAGRGMLEGPDIPDRARPYSPRELWDKRHAWKKDADLDPRAVVTPEASGRAAAYREGRNVLGGQVRGAMNEGERATYDAANEQYGLLQKANTAALDREAAELGNAPIGLGSPGMATAGALAVGGPGAAAGVIASEGLRRGYGRDLYADVARGASKALRVGETAERTAAGRVASAVEDASIAGAASGIPDDFFGASPAMAAEPLRAPPTQREAGEHPTAARVRLALAQNREHYLRGYADELEQALNEGPQAFGATLLRLQRDPEFMRDVYPVIAAGEQGAGR